MQPSSSSSQVTAYIIDACFPIAVAVVDSSVRVILVRPDVGLLGAATTEVTPSLQDTTAPVLPLCPDSVLSGLMATGVTSPRGGPVGTGASVDAGFLSLGAAASKSIPESPRCSGLYFIGLAARGTKMPSKDPANEEALLVVAHGSVSGFLAGGHVEQEVTGVVAPAMLSAPSALPQSPSHRRKGKCRT